MKNGYKDLEIWQLAHEMVLIIHEMTMKELPKHELYETGSQIRRSSKSVKSNIVEGYGRRRYKADYIRFLIFAFSSNLETQDHLETLYHTGSLKNKQIFESAYTKVDLLGKKLNRFIQSVEQYHR